MSCPKSLCNPFFKAQKWLNLFMTLAMYSFPKTKWMRWTLPIKKSFNKLLSFPYQETSFMLDHNLHFLVLSSSFLVVPKLSLKTLGMIQTCSIQESFFAENLSISAPRNDAALREGERKGASRCKVKSGVTSDTTDNHCSPSWKVTVNHQWC